MNSNSEPNSAKLEFLQRAPVWREMGLCRRLHYRFLLPSPSPQAIRVGSQQGWISLLCRAGLNLLLRATTLPGSCWHPQHLGVLRASLGDTWSSKSPHPHRPINLESSEGSRRILGTRAGAGWSYKIWIIWHRGEANPPQMQEQFWGCLLRMPG